jgi:kynureninase
MYENNLDCAKNLDNEDELAKYAYEFSKPLDKDGEPLLYFAGHSLGLRPHKAKDYVNLELDEWAMHGVEGHFNSTNPWLAYHEMFTKMMARLVGAKEKEVIVMNTLSVNLHLMMVSFYRPTKTKYKIMIEGSAFPSDHYAVQSQARFHGFDPKESIIELHPREGERILRDEDIKKAIEDHGDETALIMLGNVNYLTGQNFPMKKIVEWGHQKNCFVGFDMAHGAGNIKVDLHDWNVDFAVWCNYKYLNAGPGGMGGAFVHEKHLKDPSIPRFEGWWGQNKKERFLMEKEFKPIESAEAWQLSNPPIFSLAAFRASLEIFDEVGIDKLRKKGDQLTGYFEYLLKENCSDTINIVTPSNPEQRGNMLCLQITKGAQKVNEKLKEKGVIADFRHPDILRVAPAPLYNGYKEVFKLVKVLKELTHE